MQNEILQLTNGLIEVLKGYDTEKASQFEGMLAEILDSKNDSNVLRRFEVSEYRKDDTKHNFKSLQEVYKGYSVEGEMTDCRILYTSDSILVVEDYELNYEDLQDGELYHLLSDDYSEEEKKEQLEAIVTSLSLGNGLYERSFSPR